MNQPNTEERHVFLSGTMVPESRAMISIFDSAILLGDCVTESTRTFRHKPFRLEEHIARLYRSLKVCRVNCGMTPEEMTKSTLDVLNANLALMEI